MTLYAEILSDRQILSVEGDDALSFLQGLVTNDLQKATDATPLYAALLNPKGRYLFDIIIIKKENGFWLDVHKERADTLYRMLTLYKLRSKVSLALIDPVDISVLSIWGDKIQQAPKYPFVFTDPRLAMLGQRVYGPIDTLVSMAASHEKGDFEMHCIGQGVAAYKSGLVPEKTIVLEANFDELKAMDWQKGCYVGQELMARTHHQGMIRKRYIPFQAEQSGIEVEDAIVDDKKTNIGKVVAIKNNYGLASIRLELFDKNAFYFVNNLTIKCRIPEWISLR